MTPMGPYVNDQITPGDIWTRPNTVAISYYDYSKATYDHVSELCAIRVCFTLSEELWKRYQVVPTDLELQYLQTINTSTPFWVSLLVQSKPDTHELCADYNRLGLYALAVKNMPIPTSIGPYAPIQENATPTQPGIYIP